VKSRHIRKGGGILSEESNTNTPHIHFSTYSGLD
jgi:hypothetical protein